MKKIFISLALVSVSAAAIIAINAESNIKVVMDSNVEALAGSECLTLPGGDIGQCKWEVGGNGFVCVSTGLLYDCSSTIYR